MELDKTVLAGAGGVLAGALLTYAFGASTRADLSAQIERQAGQIAGFEAISEQVGVLDGKLDTFAASIAESTDPAVLEAALTERIEGLGARIEGVGPQVGERLSGDLAALRDRIAALAERPAGAETEAPTAPATETAAAEALPAPNPDGATGEGERIGIGQTAALADGGLRVFLSRINEADQSARIAINGQTTGIVVLGNALTAGECSVTLTGIEGREAIFDAACGEEAAAAATEADSGGAGDPDAIGIGQTVALGDGAVRVFLSGILPDGGGARVAINGQAIETLATGDSTAAGDCTVTLSGIDGRRASFAAECGGEAAGDAAPADAAAATGEGTEIGVGETGIFADGALRVFLSSFDADAGSARVAINGQSLTMLTLGSPTEAGDCTIVLTGGDGRRAILDGSC
jgi:hypothetical protein